MGNTVDVVRNMKRPRFARSHLPWHLLPKDLTTSKAKVSQMSTLMSNDFHRKVFYSPALFFIDHLHCSQSQGPLCILLLLLQAHSWFGSTV